MNGLPRLVEGVPLTKTVCQFFDSKGFSITGEDVRRAARELEITGHKDSRGRLMVSADECRLVVNFLRAKHGASHVRQ